MSSCGAPKTQSVKGYTRAAPPKKYRRPKKAAAAYWTCVHSPQGYTCGVHHKSSTAAFRHEKKLNLESYRRGRGRPWKYEKRG